jgi:hypothetical protein
MIMSVEQDLICVSALMQGKTPVLFSGLAAASSSPAGLMGKSLAAVIFAIANRHAIRGISKSTFWEAMKPICCMIEEEGYY